MSNLPVLILAYRRLNTLKVVIDALLEQNCGEIYVSSDASTNKNDIAVQEVRKYLQTLLKKGTISHLKLREENTGLASAVKDGIDWFFKSVEIGLIIEDDIILETGALDAITKLQNILLENSDIFSINLRNEVPQSHITYPINLCRISRLVSSHGWITSASKWQLFRSSSEKISINEILVEIPKQFGFFPKWAYVEAYKRNNRLKQKLLYSWDTEWQGFVFSKSGKTIQINRNLVNYAGYDSFSTHHKSPPRKKDHTIPNNLLPINQVISDWDIHADVYRFKVNMRNTFPRFLVRKFRISSVVKNRLNL